MFQIETILFALKVLPRGLFFEIQLNMQVQKTLPILFLYLIFWSFSCLAENPTPSDEALYLFHWGTPGRIQNLLNYKVLNKKAYAAAEYGTSNGAAYGNGLYVSLNPRKWARFGPGLMIIKLPTSKTTSLVPLGSSTSESIDFRIVNPDPEIRLMTFEEALRDNLKTGNFNWFNTEEAVNDLLQAVFQAKDYKALNQIELISRSKDIPLEIQKNLENLFPLTTSEFQKYQYRINVQNQMKSLTKPLVASPLNQKILTLRRFTTASDFYRSLGLSFQHLDELYLYFMSLRKSDIQNLPQKVYYLIYGESAFKAFELAASQVDYDSKEIMTLKDLKSLHRIAYPKDGTFVSFYYNEIGKLKNNGVRKEALKWAQENRWDQINKLLNIAPPFGVLRNGPLYITRPATSSEGEGRSFFTEDEIYRLMQNPNIRVEILSSSSEGVKAKLAFPYHDNFEAEVESIFKQMREESLSLQSQKNKSTEQYVNEAIRIASDFYWELSSRHVFWDGSGRTVRLARDWVLKSLGLPPAAYTPENDWELTKPELRLETRKAVMETLQFYDQNSESAYSVVLRIRSLQKQSQILRSVKCNAVL